MHWPQFQSVILNERQSELFGPIDTENLCKFENWYFYANSYFLSEESASSACIFCGSKISSYSEDQLLQQDWLYTSIHAIADVAVALATDSYPVEFGHYNHFGVAVL